MAEPIVEPSTETVFNVARTGTIKVLHVDDDQEFLKVAKQCLDTQGEFEVDTASSVKEALGKLKKTDYDAIVSDYQMPGKDGLEFLKELREKGNTVPFIVFTGKGREEIAIEALNLGAAGYFNKAGHPETVYGELAHGIRQAVERKRVSEALLESERKSRTLLENLPQKIFFKDRNSVYISCNENYARDLKIKSDEIAGRTDYVFFPRELAEKYRADDKRIMKSGNTEDIKEMYIQDGQKAFVHTVKTPVKDEKGNVVGILGIFWDITERKKADEKLWSLKEFNERIVDSISDSLLVIDPNDYRIISVNEAALKQLMLRKGDLIGKTCYEITHNRSTPCEPPLHICPIQEVLKTGKPVTIEHTHLDKGNNEILLEVSAYPVRNHERNIVQVLHLTRDITERRESEKKFRVLTEQSPNMIFMNKMGKVVYANKKCEEIVGYRTEELCSPDFNFLTLIAPEFIDQVKSTFRRHMEGENIAPYECTLLTKEGKRITAIIATNLITYKGEKTILGIITDITERKKADEEKGKTLHDRVKELNCLYGISRLVEKTDISLDDLLQGVADLLPPAMQHPDITCARIVVENREFSTKNFKETRWKLQADIKVHGKKAGFVEVRYLEERPTIAEGPFLKEEWDLIDAVAERLGRIIERKKAENALKESEEKYRSLFELAPDSIITANTKGVITSVNTTFTRLTGFSKDEIVSKHLTKVGTIRKRDLPMFQKMFTSILRGKAPKPFEAMWKHKDGTTHPTEIHVTLVKSDGKTIGFQAITRDITERKKAEGALRDAKQKWVSMMENTDDVIMILNGKGVIQDLNPSPLVANPREVIGKSVYEYVPREQHDIMRESLRRVFKTGKPDSYEVSPSIQGIDTVWFNTKIVPIKHDKNTVSVILISTDITERKKAEKTLQESEERFRAIFEGANDGILVADVKTKRFAFANPRICEITGYSLEELLKLGVSDLTLRKTYLM